MYQPCFCLFFKKICAPNFITEATRMRRAVFKDYFPGVSYWYGDVQKCVADTCSEDRNRCGCHFSRSGRVSYDACKKTNKYKMFQNKKNSQPMEQRILSTKVPTPIREPSFILRRLTIFNITYSSPKCNELQMFLDGSWLIEACYFARNFQYYLYQINLSRKEYVK